MYTDEKSLPRISYAIVFRFWHMQGKIQTQKPLVEPSPKEDQT